MPIIRNALSRVLGDVVPSPEERNLQRQAKDLQKDSRKAGRHGGGAAVNLQAIQTQLSYEIVKEQRYIRLGDMAQAQKCRVVIQALQQQIAASQPMQQPYFPQMAYQADAAAVSHLCSRSSVLRHLPRLPHHATAATPVRHAACYLLYPCAAHRVHGRSASVLGPVLPNNAVMQALDG